MYQSCQLQKGGRFGILQGLRKLYVYCGDIERTYQQVLRMYPSQIYSFLTRLVGQKLNYGQHREPWKETKKKYGTTHPARHNDKKRKESDDGRAPDTTNKLTKSSRQQKPLSKEPKLLKPFLHMQSKMHDDGLRLFRDFSVQGYPWNMSSSCWFDSALEALFFCFLHLKNRFTDAVSQCEEPSPRLKLLSKHMQSRLNVYTNAETIPQMQTQLSDLRDELSWDLDLNLHEDNNPLVNIATISRLMYSLGSATLSKKQNRMTYRKNAHFIKSHMFSFEYAIKVMLS